MFGRFPSLRSATSLTLFSSTTSSDVFRIVSDTKFNSGCRSIPAVAAEILKSCGVTEGVNHLPANWAQVASYLGGDVLFEQGLGQDAKAEAAQCIKGFLDAFARGFPADSQQLPVWLIVTIAVLGCVLLLGAAVCAAGTTAAVCYGINKRRQGADEEQPLLSYSPFANPSAGR